MDTDSQQHDLVKHVLDAGFPLNATSLIHLFVGTQDQVFELGDDLARECQQLLENSDLPDSVDVNVLSQQIADAYQFHWRLCASTDD